MKRKVISWILVAGVLLLTLFGCTKQAAIPEKNSLFTDAFFADVVAIRDINCGQVSGEQMEPVIEYLKGLTLTETNEHLSSVDENGNLLYGAGAITFTRSDGTEVMFLRNNARISNESLGSYNVADGNLSAGLKDAFNQGLKQSGN